MPLKCSACWPRCGPSSPQADRTLGPRPDVPLDSAAARSLLALMEPLDAPIHSLVVEATHSASAQVGQHYDTVRDQGRSGLILTALLSATSVGFALLALCAVAARSCSAGANSKRWPPICAWRSARPKAPAGQERLPGQHEPRTAHAVPGPAGHAAAARQRNADRGAAPPVARRPRIGRPPARHLERRARRGAPGSRHAAAARGCRCRRTSWPPTCRR